MINIVIINDENKEKWQFHYLYIFSNSETINFFHFLFFMYVQLTVYYRYTRIQMMNIKCGQLFFLELYRTSQSVSRFMVLSVFHSLRSNVLKEKNVNRIFTDNIVYLCKRNALFASYLLPFKHYM